MNPSLNISVYLYLHISQHLALKGRKYEKSIFYILNKHFFAFFHNYRHLCPLALSKLNQFYGHLGDAVLVQLVFLGPEVRGEGIRPTQHLEIQNSVHSVTTGDINLKS